MIYIYNELRAWQGAIGSGLGFLALFLGAFWNFHLNRRRDAHLRDEEVASVAAALYGELLLLRRAVGRLATRYAQHYIDVGVGRTRREIDSYFIDDTRLPESQIYNALVSKIGMLPPDVVLAIVSFHANAERAQAYLSKMAPDEKRGFNYSPLYVLEASRDAVVDVLPTLERLAMIAGIRNGNHEVLLGKTDTVIEMERESWDQLMSDSED